MTPRPGFDSTGLQWCWDATALSALMTCPRYYDYTIRQGWRRPRGEGDHDLVFGKLLHSGWETIKKAIHAGRDRDEALLDGLEAVLKAAWVDREKWTCGSCDSEVGSADEACSRCGASFAETDKMGHAAGHYWESTDRDRRKTLPNLLRTIVWGFESLTRILESSVGPDGKPMIEVGLEVDLDRSLPSGEHHYRMRARLDEVVTDGSLSWILEKKTTGKTLGKAYFSTFSPNAQISLQDWLGWKHQDRFDPPFIGVLVEAHQVGVRFSRFGQEFVRRGEERREEFERTIHFWLDIAEKCHHDGEWAMNERACYNCGFKAICSSPPSLRKGLLEAGYDKVLWNPVEGEELRP